MFPNKLTLFTIHDDIKETSTVFKNVFKWMRSKTSVLKLSRIWAWENHPCSFHYLDGFLELSELKASSIGGDNSIHLLSSEFMHQSMIQADQPAGREWLVREDK